MSDWIEKLRLLRKLVRKYDRAETYSGNRYRLYGGGCNRYGDRITTGCPCLHQEYLAEAERCFMQEHKADIIEKAQEMAKEDIEDMQSEAAQVLNSAKGE